MNCPTCNSPLEQNARFCGVCGYQVQHPGRANAATKPAPAKPKPRPKVDDIYLEQVLNNRFRVESKIGEGGFGAVYRGIQLATGRKVALKLLHPEMTKDENLVARFRREGMVLCNLRDAHTITTYDFDQTPDGTLYIAMELLEGKSLHQLFHAEAPLEWKRMFKILTEMCSSLAEAHAQGIVHRDLKPENVYLESRPGNPEFVKILDFGIAKVMRGDTIDPQSPQLTATGQTLGTLEYMSPEQLMGKALDGRSDVYALGVVAYEMITGRLPFPDAKGPAGLITAQLKQTPIPPSQANPKAAIPPAADRVILKCLEKDKNNRFPDVSTFSAALQEVINQAMAELNPLAGPGMQSSPGHRIPPPGVASPGMASPGMASPGMASPGPLDARREPAVAPSPAPAAPPQQQSPPSLRRPPPSPPAGTPVLPAPMPITPSLPGIPQSHSGIPHSHGGIPHSYSGIPQGPGSMPTPYPLQPQMPGSGPVVQGQHPYGQPMAQSQPTPVPLPMAQIRPPGGYPPHTAPVSRHRASNIRLIWWIVGLLVLGAGVGAAIAYLLG